MKKVSAKCKIVVSLMALLLYVFALLLTPITLYQVHLSWQSSGTAVLFRYTQRLPSSALGMKFLEGSSTAGTIEFTTKDVKSTSTGTYVSQDGRWYLSEKPSAPTEVTLRLTCYVPLLARVFDAHSDQQVEFPQYHLSYPGEYIKAETGSRLQADRTIDAFRTEIVTLPVLESKPFVTFSALFTIEEVLFLCRIWRKKELPLILVPCKLLGLLVCFCLPFYYFSPCVDIMALVLVTALNLVQYCAIRRYKRE